MNRPISFNYPLIPSLTRWLEYHWATPAYGGWVLIGISLSFFGAATNTMAGWLYVLSGVLLSLLGLNFILAINNLKRLKITRKTIEPISAGDELTIELIISNPTNKPKILIEIIDQLPSNLSNNIYNKIETVSGKSHLKLVAYTPTNKRGIYHWQNITLKTAAPFGLFYCSREKEVEGKAIIYPQILPLQNCPLIDHIGNEKTQQQQSDQFYQNATEGVTKAIRPYRYGDPTRLIHWRSSARFGDLQVRELETITGGEEVIICLDNTCQWQDKYFEEAVIAVASMFFYASRQQLNVKLWTGETGIIHGTQVMLETLAGINYGVTTIKEEIPHQPVIWLSQDFNSLSSLVFGSRWMLFPSMAENESNVKESLLRGFFYEQETPLQIQLQKPLN